jgi:phosphatidylserine/phosphatidylglycerophosphate/cardiolipin synthase-like enzyme
MSIEVFFNRPGHVFDIQRLYQDVRGAQEQLTVASAWFTDTKIAEAIIASPARDKLVLLNAADLGRGDKRAVTMIKQAAADDEALTRRWERDIKNPDIILHPQMPTFRMVVLGSRDFTQGVMHHKFIAIDDMAVWTGSFNFTYNAQRNYENLLRISDPAIVAQYHEEAAQCSRHVWSDDSDGMVMCAECRTRFYPDEDVNLVDSHGGFMCTKCRAREDMYLVDLSDPPKPAPAKVAPTPPRLPAIKKAVRINQK